MSIKIYNGWKLGSMDVFDIQKKVKNVFHPLLLQNVNQGVMWDAIQMQDKLFYDNGRFAEYVHHDAEETDHFRFSPDRKGQYTFLDLYSIACKMQKKNREDSFTQMNIEVVYFRHPSTGELFCFFYGSHEMAERFEEEFGEPFSYWNNSEQPDDITDDEWANRLRTWEEVFDLDRPVGPQGLTQTVLSSYELEARWSYVREGGKLILPTVADRAKSLAGTCADREYIDLLKETGEEIRFSWFSSDKRKERVALLEKEISGTLEEISLEDLTNTTN